MSTITGIFTVGKDAQSIGSAGTVVFSIAENHSKKNGDEWKTITSWFEAVCFGKQAEKALTDIKKGVKVFISGEFSTDAYKTQSGEEKQQLKIMVNKFQILDKKQNDNSSSTSKEYEKAKNTTPLNDYVLDDDIPF